MAPDQHTTSSNTSPNTSPSPKAGRLQLAAATALGAALVAGGGWYLDPTPAAATSGLSPTPVAALPPAAPIPDVDLGPVMAQRTTPVKAEPAAEPPRSIFENVVPIDDFAGEAAGKMVGNLADPFAGESSPPAGLPEVVMVDPFADADAPAQAGQPLGEDDVQFVDAYSAGDIHVNDAPINEVLRMLSQQTQLNIIAHKGVAGTVTANLYGVTVHEALDVILTSHGLGYREQDNFIHVYTQDALDQLDNVDRAAQTRVFRLYHLTASDAAALINPVLSENAIVGRTADAQTGLTAGGGVSGSGGVAYAGEDLLVITDYEDRLAQVQQLLDEADRRPPQILIEATILRAALTENNQLGVDFNVLGGVDFTDVSFSGGQAVGAGVGGDTSPDAVTAGTGNSFSGSVPGGLRLGLVTGDVSLFLSALEGVTDTVVMANPKVLAVNRQEGRILVGREDGYLTTTVSETVATQTVQFLQTGTLLTFRPFVSGDGYVRLEVHPEDSDGGLNEDNLPFKITTEVTTNVMVKDGHTVVIGGLFRETSTTSRSQVPGLGNLPVVGAAFRNQSDRTLREEIIILLTPHVIKDDERYSEQSKEELATAEKLRVGVREGMMPWGRERLAEGFYERPWRSCASPSRTRRRRFSTSTPPSTSTRSSSRRSTLRRS